MERESMRITAAAAPHVEVVIEVPRGSFLKRGSSGSIDFVSPVPCPYNYGSVPDYIGGEGDLLDAVVLGPRLAAGTKIRVRAYGAIGFSERFMYDDKLICSEQDLTSSQRRNLLIFFTFYSRCKGVLNLFRGRRGRARCEGWSEAAEALGRAIPAGDVPARTRASY
ncbi:inorganic diphosphatase [Halieaceae bacterium IMCC14734]|uniref:inorganic diphosphatase n=1 Tax=Candidatus Litorirhabdus singularis TaxID=2518993 RepID=A0ABT3TG31_9GAMM|nr:inorganic diphosphatase [Candidatus Litorirhabdus singularis]MCX2981267.1 inorganic diphosphatase [Candidatus Litorirhabdus singularis]